MSIPFKVLVLFGFICCTSTAQTSKKADFKAERNSGFEAVNRQPQNLDIYLLIGQSNMAGRAEIEAQDKDTLKNVFLFKGDAGDMWEKAANPLNKYSSVRKDLSMQKLNPGYTFASEMVKFSANPIGLVVNARGGTSIKLWEPGSEYYMEAVGRTKLALQYGTLRGILWHQGESDVMEYDSYLIRLTALIRSFRSDFGLPDLPFVAGQLSGAKSRRQDFNKMIIELPKILENAGVVRSNKTSTTDSTHFDSASQRLLGKRYAREMKKILK